jgi:aminoglycoside phosphotransferase (APT) family kinase protein
MDARRVRALLAAERIDVTSSDVRIQTREDRWVAWLSGGRIAWFPINGRGLQRLQTERRVLELLVSRCSFRVPRVLHVSEAGWQVRSLVPGVCEPWTLYQRLQGDRALAKNIGHSLGAILAEQHTAISYDDVKGWLPTHPRWPEPWASVEARLPEVVQETDLLREISGVIRRCQAEETIKSGDRVLVHGDLGLHNIAVEPSTGIVQGVFDYDGASWADRHYDFRYFIFDQQQEDLLDGALEVYEAALGAQLDRYRIRLFNAACAIGFLAFRYGTQAEALSCGRTLAQDLEWVRYALRAIR